MEEELSDLIFLRKLISVVAVFMYLCGGLYWFYPEVLNMLFWPFHYGWLSH